MKKVVKDKAFYFFTGIGNYTGKSAASLSEFLKQLKQIDSPSLRFHQSRGDFQRWLRDVWRLNQPADRLEELATRNLEGELLRTQLTRILTDLLEGGDVSLQEGKKRKLLPLEEYLKQLPAPPKEHAYELLMEKRLKLLVDQHKQPSALKPRTAKKKRKTKMRE